MNPYYTLTDDPPQFIHARTGDRFRKGRMKRDVYRCALTQQTLEAPGMAVIMWSKGRGIYSQIHAPDGAAVANPVRKLGLRTLEKGIVQLNAIRDVENPCFLDLLSLFQQYAAVRNQRALRITVIHEFPRVFQWP